MKRLFAATFFVLFNVSGMYAQAPACSKAEVACVLDAAWGAALVLPQEKRARLAPTFLEIAALSGDPDVLAHWQNRLGGASPERQTYPDYGWQKAQPILRQGGVDRLIQAATQREAPLSFGRADVLLSAGKHLLPDDAIAAEKLNTALLSLARGASSFEQPVLAHAAAELAMTRCDAGSFSSAIRLTSSPGNLRYDFWRARIEGNSLKLLDRIRAIDTDEDTREVRRVLEGYRAIQELGYCNQSNIQIGG